MERFVIDDDSCVENGSEDYRISRGGNIFRESIECRAASRFFGWVGTKANCYGFRIACDIF